MLKRFLIASGGYKLFGGLFLGWGIGANDSANIFGTAVATHSVRFRTAVWLIAAAHLGLVSWTMVSARRVQNLRDDLARLQRDNALLERRVARMESVSRLLAEAEAEGFVLPSHVEFVESR